MCMAKHLIWLSPLLHTAWSAQLHSFVVDASGVVDEEVAQIEGNVTLMEPAWPRTNKCACTKYMRQLIFRVKNRDACQRKAIQQKKKIFNLGCVAGKGWPCEQCALFGAGQCDTCLSTPKSKWVWKKFERPEPFPDAEDAPVPWVRIGTDKYGKFLNNCKCLVNMNGWGFEVNSRDECQAAAVNQSRFLFNLGVETKTKKMRCLLLNHGSCPRCSKPYNDGHLWQLYQDPAGPNDPKYANVTDDGVAAGFPMKCSMETAIKRYWNYHFSSPTTIRSVFHDAMDHNNLLVKNDRSGKWEPFELTEGNEYGGLDGCLYSPLTDGDRGFPNPGHNRNVPGILPQAHDLCRAICDMDHHLKICKGPKYKGVSSGCKLDVTILAANAVIEKLKGPKIPMLWGHKKGNCGFDGVVTPFVKFCKEDCQNKYSQLPALRFAPSFTDIHHPEHFAETFRRMGFNATEHVALMGAHSVGVIEPCAEGLNGIEIGPWCKSEGGQIPQVTSGEILPQKGTCQISHKHSCWRKQPNGNVVPVHKNLNGNNILEGYGDGGIWDQTPNRFDNHYFRVMKDSDYDDMNLCCGSAHGNSCDRTGSLMRLNANGVTSKNNTQGKECNGARVSFCRDDRKGRTHMKSMNMWRRVQANLLKNAAQHGNILRVVRLPGDWALLGGEETKAVVQEFAEDQTKFHAAFKAAWEKVLRKSTSPLESCGGEHNEQSAKYFTDQLMVRTSLLEKPMQDSDLD